MRYGGSLLMCSTPCARPRPALQLRRGAIFFMDNTGLLDLYPHELLFPPSSLPIDHFHLRGAPAWPGGALHQHQGGRAWCAAASS